MHRLFYPSDGVKRKYMPLLLISLVGLFYVAGNGSVWFALPLLANKIVDDFMLVGLLIAVPNLVSLFLDVPVGGLSDRLGRKKMLSVGLFVMLLLGLALPFISTVVNLIVFLVVFGVANQFIYIAIRAHIMDISPKNETSKYFGFFEALASIGFTIAPVIGGVLIADNLMTGAISVGLFNLLMCLIGLIFVFLVKEAITSAGFASSVKDLIRKDKLVLRELVEFKDLKSGGAMILLITFVIVVADGLIWTMGPLYTTLGLDTEMVGIILSMFVLPFILFDIPFGMLADKIGKTKTMFTGLLIAGAFLIYFGQTRDSTMLIAAAFLATTGLALVRPSIDGLLTDLAESKQKGGIVGVWDVSEDLGYVIGPILGGIIAEYYQNIGFAFTGMGLILLLITPLVLLAAKKN